MRNPTLETPGLEVIDFIKRSIKEIVGSAGMPKMRNLALEPPGREMIDFIKRSIKENLLSTLSLDFGRAETVSRHISRYQF